MAMTFTQADLNLRYFNAVISEVMQVVPGWEDAARIEAMICDATKRLAQDLAEADAAVARQVASDFQAGHARTRLTRDVSFKTQ